MKKIIIGIIIAIIVAFLVFGLFSGDGDKNVKNVTTTYNTTCQLDIGNGMIPDETGVTENTQVLAFDDGYNIGYFISMPKDEAADLISIIETGTKCRNGDIVYYHLEDKELANSWGAFGTHLKLKTVNSMDAGFVESPVSDEVIIVIGGPDNIVNCINSIKWG